MLSIQDANIFIRYIDHTRKEGGEQKVQNDLHR